jgi:hypothetical protein
VKQGRPRPEEAVKAIGGSADGVSAEGALGAGRRRRDIGVPPSEAIMTRTQPSHISESARGAARTRRQGRESAVCSNGTGLAVILFDGLTDSNGERYGLHNLCLVVAASFTRLTNFTREVVVKAWVAVGERIAGGERARVQAAILPFGGTPLVLSTGAGLARE